MAQDRWNRLERHKQRLQTEGLRLYRPSPLQLPFHESDSHEAVLRGGKRSGKSVAAAMEFASRVLGIPIQRPDGTEITLRWPTSTPDNPLQYWIIGWDTKHATTIHKLLFQRGMGGTLRAIQDTQTGEWRIWNRADPQDRARAKESVLTEPLIPERFWKGTEDESFSWTEKKTRQFHSFEAANGAMVYFWPSSARNPKQGEAVAGEWIDEDIQFASHLSEWQDRLTDLDGWFFWSAWPHVENNALSDLMIRADREIEMAVEKPRIRSFQLIMTQNPFLAQEGKEAALARMGSDDEIARRDRGETMLGALSMYDFHPTAHLIRAPEPGSRLPENPSALQKLRHIYCQQAGFPREWTRYLTIDPSNTRTACHSWAVPPEQWEGVRLGRVAIVEWELVAARHSADKLAAALLPLMAGRNYEAFVMDWRIGRQTNTGRDEPVFDHYAEKFALQGLQSRTTQSYFVPGCDQPPVRQRAVREMMTAQDTGIPMLLLVENTTPATQREFGTYRKKRIDQHGVEVILDEPANPRIHDCMASIEYGAAFLLPLLKSGRAYQEASQYPTAGSPAYRRAQEILKRSSQQQSGEYVHLGPGDHA